MRLAEISRGGALPRETLNPTARQLAALLRNSKENCLRGALNDDALVVWDAYYATHYQMGYGDVSEADGYFRLTISEEGVEHRIDLPDEFDRDAWNWGVIGIDEAKVSQMSDDELIDALVGYYRRIVIANPHLRRAYGGDPPLITTAL